MNQLLIGAIIPFLLGALIYFLKNRRISTTMLIIFPIFMLFGGIWAIIPDIPRIFGYKDLYFQLSKDPRCDIFFWHYTIDQIESDTTFFVYPFLFIFIALLAVALRELHLREKEL